MSSSGSLRDYTESWTASYTFSGVSILCGSAVLLLDPLAVKYEQSRTRRREAAKNKINDGL